MCGIAGKVHDDGARPVAEELLRRMCTAMVHRGPDDEGVYTDGAVGLGMRRLKVIDLEGGHQPMANEDGTVWLVFNGEIYNYRSLRQELSARGHAFRTASDTEAIVHLYEEHGTDCFARLEGMFAIALWDRRRRRLVLARDRMGKKPLFYARTATGLTFGSEIGVVLQDDDVDRAIDEGAIDRYLSLLFVPQPRTAFRQVRKLAPGCLAVYRDGALEERRYWQLPEPAAEAGPRADGARTLDTLLDAAVRSRLVADVPVGAFLSGGLDSSLVTAYMKRAAGDVRTFAVGFRDDSFDELAHARRVAAVLGTRHEEETVDYDAREIVPQLLTHFGEPFADSSAIPQYYLARMTRRSVTVALSGDGGDEVFGGYRRYSAWLWADLYNRLLPAPARWLAEGAARRLREPSVYYGRSVRKRLKRFAEFAAVSRERPAASWAIFFRDAERRSLYTAELAERLQGEADPPGAWAPGNPGSRPDLLRVDLAAYLPDDILVKVDRMSMACSLEVRAPFLDRRVVEFMAGAPLGWKVTRRQRKVLLREVARNYLPDSVVDRPKHGFAIPLAGWLQGPLRGWMEELLSRQAVEGRGWFRAAAVERMRCDHGAGRRDYSQQLWALMVLELWLRQVARSY